MADILAEFEKRIAANKRELEEQEHALAVLRRTMGQPIIDNAEKLEEKSPITTINFEELIDASGKSKKRTLLDNVREVVSHFGKNEFTVAHIEAALKKLGVSIDAKNPRARIGIAVSNIVEEGTIIKTAAGGGNVPHRYKLKSVVDSESLV